MRLFFVLSLVLFSLGSFAQDSSSDSSLLKKAVVVDAFKNKQVISAQTTVIPDGLDFTMMYRFGKIGLDNRLYKDFLGFDSPANIRFSLSYGVTERLYIGVGRTKIGKTIDIEGKYVFLRQLSDNSPPLSVAIFNNTGINTEPFNDYGPNAFFSDSISPFKSMFSHRVIYTTELILSRKFNDNLSLQLSPTMVYKNLVLGLEEDHFTFVLPLSGRFQHSFGGAFLFEYAHKINNRTMSALDNSFSFGLEFDASGQVFQIFMSNSYFIREANIYTLDPYDFYQSPNEFVFGFNIRRTW